MKRGTTATTKPQEIVGGGGERRPCGTRARHEPTTPHHHEDYDNTQLLSSYYNEVHEERNNERPCRQGHIYHTQKEQRFGGTIIANGGKTIDSHRDCLQYVACIATLTELLSQKTNERHSASQLLSVANLLHTSQKNTLSGNTLLQKPISHFFCTVHLHLVKTLTNPVKPIMNICMCSDHDQAQ